MNSTAIEESDEIYRLRHGTLQSVDDLIAEIFTLLEAAGEVDNTYFFFTSDNVCFSQERDHYHVNIFRASIWASLRWDTTSASCTRATAVSRTL
jgi:arylsulfatase A-like enzyme